MRLSYCHFLLDSGTVGADDIDSGGADGSVDGLARLDGEVGNGKTVHIEDAYVSLATE